MGSPRNNRKIILILAAASMVVAVVLAIIAANFTFIKDVFVGMRYRPSGEMTEIFDALELTDDGQRIFKASLPELMEREEFNQKCRETTNESAILGCYTDERIFVFDIESDELAGIRELTTAHELLHAVYHRMSDGEKMKWNELLSRVYKENEERLGEEIGTYAKEQQAEELYVRAGTEVKGLPEELERHFAGIFKNQDKVVEFYESYISVFEKIERRMEELLGKVNDLSAQVDAKVSEYETRAAALNQAAAEFNECAQTTDCFSSTAVFNARRAELVNEQSALKTLYQEINDLIEKHNKYVSEYNESALHGQTLNKVINSSEEVTSGD